MPHTHSVLCTVWATIGHTYSVVYTGHSCRAIYGAT